MKTIIRDGSIPLALNKSSRTRYLRDRRLSELIKRCRRLEKEGFDYLIDQALPSFRERGF